MRASALATNPDVVSFILHQDPAYLKNASRGLVGGRLAVWGDTALMAFRFRSGNETEVLSFHFQRVQDEWRVRGVMQPNRM
jgi:hypothetical protein